MGNDLSMQDFKHYWRYNDEKYVVLSEQELSAINVLQKSEVKKEWMRICGEEIFQKSVYINDIINHTAPVLIKDCCWGEEENNTKEALMSFFEKCHVDKVSIYYDFENGLQLPTSVFCERWSDFCYPSDLILIVLSSAMIVYYEDIVYGPYKV